MKPRQSIHCLNRFLACWVALIWLVGCGNGPGGQRADHADSTSEPRTVVLWISIDGLRSDYIDRARTPLLDRLMEQGAYSHRLRPGFPSLTFPSHVTQATGVGVSGHGISGNIFHDPQADEVLRYPSAGELLEAEPIWITAPRQGVRTAVSGWPLSHAQEGPVRSDYFDDAFDPELTDAQRVRNLMSRWRADEADQPLQLLMGYMSRTDSVGHQFGPDSPEVEQAMAETDAHLQRLLDQAVDWFDRTMGPEDQLYFILTTDHGMAAVHTLVNLEVLLDIDLPEEAVVVPSANVANIHLHAVEPAEARRELEEEILARLEGHDFITGYRRDDLPPHWGYDHPRRVGEIVLLLDPGYSYNRRLPRPTYGVEEADGPLGMHGYPVEESDEMYGFALFWRYPEPLDRRDLGEIDSRQLHPTVARLLGIDPAAAAAAEPIELP